MISLCMCVTLSHDPFVRFYAWVLYNAGILSELFKAKGIRKTYNACYVTHLWISRSAK